MPPPLAQDKATLDVDIMDDGFLAKILKPQGSKDVLVGDPIAVVVAEASDVGAFKTFTIESTGGGGGAAAPQPKMSDDNKVNNVARFF